MNLIYNRYCVFVISLWVSFINKIFFLVLYNNMVLRNMNIINLINL